MKGLYDMNTVHRSVELYPNAVLSEEGNFNVHNFVQKRYERERVILKCICSHTSACVTVNSTRYRKKERKKKRKKETNKEKK